MKKVILVIDMLRGFLEEGYPLYCGPKARKIIPKIKKLLKQEKDAELIYLCDHHEPDDAEFKMFPCHCVVDTPETEVIPELKKFPGRIISKTRYSGFFKTELENALIDLKPDEVIVVGVCTDICVMFTVADLRNRDYQVVVPRKCVASFDQKAHRFALQHMEKTLGAKIIK